MSLFIIICFILLLYILLKEEIDKFLFIIENKIDKKININLTKEELKFILKWFDKGYSNKDLEQPLFDKLKNISDNN